MNDTRTFGPTYDPAVDGRRLQTQMLKIRDYMLGTTWHTLPEIEGATGYPQASISAQLRHLRKERFGSYVVEKRRRGTGGTYEYRVFPPKCNQSWFAWDCSTYCDSLEA